MVNAGMSFRMRCLQNTQQLISVSLYQFRGDFIPVPNSDLLQVQVEPWSSHGSQKMAAEVSCCYSR